MLRFLGKLGVIGVGAAATVLTVNASEAYRSPSPSSSTFVALSRRYNLPESCFPAFSQWNWNWDGLEPGPTALPPSTIQEGECEGDDEASSGTEVAAPTARRNIILVRHGKYNQDGTEDDTNHTLTDLGKKQAAFAGEKLNSFEIKFTSITSSEMIRAKQTACIILKNMDDQSHLNLVHDPLLNEGAPCVPEPPYKKVSLWNPSQREFLVEGSRIEAAFRKYFHRAEPSQTEDSYEIIVCHANVIRYFTCRALQFPPEGWIRMAIDHCSITRFVILPTGEVILRGLGDSGYIPHEHATVA